MDAATLLADVHRENNLGRTTLKHIKSFLSGVFTYAKNQGVVNGVNPVQDAMIPKKASPPCETHAATFEEVLAIMDVLEKAGEQEACAAVALHNAFLTSPGEPIILNSSRHHESPLTLISSSRNRPAVIMCSREIFSEQPPRQAARRAFISNGMKETDVLSRQSALCSTHRSILLFSSIISKSL